MIALRSKRFPFVVPQVPVEHPQSCDGRYGTRAAQAPGTCVVGEGGHARPRQACHVTAPRAGMTGTAGAAGSAHFASAPPVAGGGCLRLLVRAAERPGRESGRACVGKACVRMCRSRVWPVP